MRMSLPLGSSSNRPALRRFFRLVGAISNNSSSRSSGSSSSSSSSSSNNKNDETANSTSRRCPRDWEEPGNHVNSSVKSYEDVPGPKAIPILGNTWRLFPLIGQYEISDVAKISKIFYEQYGEITRLSGLMGRPDLLFVYNADEIEKIYRNEGPTPFRPSMPCLVRYKSVVRKQFFGDLPGVVGVHGEAWKEFRTRVQKPVLQPNTVRKYTTPIEVVTNDFIKRIEEIKGQSDEVPADFDNEIHKWALECIGRVALDVRLGCLEKNLTPESEPQRIIDAAKFALRNVAELELKAPYWRYIPTPLWSRYLRNMDYFIEICTKHIDAAMVRLRNKESDNIDEEDLSLVERILAKEADPKIAYVLALDLILVGIDTISMAVCSILYQLATRPEEQDRIYRELAEVMPDPETPLTTRHLDRLTYTKAFVREVFRVYSTVIGNGRTLQRDTIICGYRIPKGVQVVFPTLVTGNMDEWVDDAKTFKPSRWLKDSADDKLLHPFASLPYGYGARMCLGRRFADLEIQVLLAKLIRSYKLEYHHEPLRYKVTFMYAPDGPLKFKIIKR